MHRPAGTGQLWSHERDLEGGWQLPESLAVDMQEKGTHNSHILECAPLVHKSQRFS
jgi:hypothetical protein